MVDRFADTGSGEVFIVDFFEARPGGEQYYSPDSTNKGFFIYFYLNFKNILFSKALQMLKYEFFNIWNQN